MTKQTTTITIAEARKHMDVYVQCNRNKEALRASIANELKAYDENMKLAAEQLLAFGKANRDSFDVKDNLDLGSGYLHISHNSQVVVKPKFDAKEFGKKFKTLFDVSKAFSLAELKKLWLKDSKALKSHGVELTSEESMQVLVHKDAQP